MHKIKHFAFGALMFSLTVGVSLPAHAADEEVNYQPFSLRAEAGTLGLGVSAGWRFADHLGVHAGVNYFGYSEDGNDIEGVSYNSELRLLSAPIALDIYPWHNRSFRISVGALINMNRLEGMAPAQSGVFIPIGNSGPIGIDSAAIGGLNLEVEQQIFSPFISFGGSFNLNRAKTLSLDYEMGVAYTGNPKVSLINGNRGVDSNIDNQVDIERQQIEDKAKDFKFYPIVKISVSFSF